MVSLCKNGVLGGRITADDEKLTYRTGKLTVPAALRNLEIAYTSIQSYTQGGFFPFPTVTLHLKNGETYKFIVFARKAFLRVLQDKGVFYGNCI